MHHKTNTHTHTQSYTVNMKGKQQRLLIWSIQLQDLVWSIVTFREGLLNGTRPPTGRWECISTRGPKPEGKGWEGGFVASWLILVGPVMGVGVGGGIKPHASLMAFK